MFYIYVYKNGKGRTLFLKTYVEPASDTENV